MFEILLRNRVFFFFFFFGGGGGADGAMVLGKLPVPGL